MTGPGVGVIDTEHAAVLGLVDDLAGRWPTPYGDHGGDDEAEVLLAQAQRDLADSGLWALGLPEACGGGSADLPTTQTVIARVSGHRPALGVAMAHLHAAGEALDAEDPGLLAAAEGGCVGVVELSAAAHGLGRRVARLALGPRPVGLVLLSRDGCALVPASGVTLGGPVRRTGLDGLFSGPAEIDTDDVRQLGADPGPVRARLWAGQLAVAAGLADAASRHTAAYSAQRVQFGAPLDTLPTMRDRLAVLHGHAASLLGLATRPQSDGADALAVLREALDRAIDSCRLAIQSFGGYGYLEEYPVARLFRDAVSLRAAADVDSTDGRSGDMVRTTPG